MDKLYPDLGHYLEEETTVAIAGASMRPAIFSRPVPAPRSSSSPSSKAVKRPPQRLATAGLPDNNEPPPSG